MTALESFRPCPPSARRPLQSAIARALHKAPISVSCLVGLTTAVAVIASADAATFTVANTSSSGAGSLRQAVARANARAGADEIVFAPGVQASIDISAGALLVTDALTVTGPGKDVLTLDGGGAAGIFDATASLGISGLSMVNAGGDAIRIRSAGDANLYVRASVIAGASGAGIIGERSDRKDSYNLPSISIADTTITGNGAAGIDVVHEDFRDEQVFSVDVDRSVIERNHGDGIAVDCYCDFHTISRGPISIKKSTIADNGQKGINQRCSSVDLHGSAVVGNGDTGIYSEPCRSLPLWAASVNASSASIVGNGGYGIDAISSTIARSTISANDAGGVDSMFLNLSDSTIQGNGGTGVRAGGTWGWGDYEAAVNIVNSTISGNTGAPSGSGGGLAISGKCDDYFRYYDLWKCASIYVSNSTISGNTSAGAGGGINIDFDLNGVPYFDSEGRPTNYFTPPQLANVIIAGNSASSNDDLNISGEIASVGTTSVSYSLIGERGTARFVEPVPGSNLFNVDPKLGPLAENGGPTKTHVLLPGSPAIDTGDPDFVFGAPPEYDMSLPDYDQRGPGFPRVQTGRLDIGAFEVGAKVAPTFLLRALGDVNGNGTDDFAVVTHDGHGATRAMVRDGGTGGQVRDFEVTQVAKPLVIADVPHYAGSKAAELAVVGDSLAAIHDVRTGGQLSLFGVPAPAAIAVIHSRRVPWIAVAAETSSTVRLIHPRNLWAPPDVRFHADLRPKGLVVAVDQDGNAMLGMLGENVDPSRGSKVQLRNPENGALLGNLWLGTGYTLHQSIVVGDVDGDGIGEVATLRTKPGIVNVVLHDPVTTKQVRGIGFGPRFEPIAIAAAGDVNGNGAADVALLARRTDNGVQRLDVKDGRTGALLSRVWLPKAFVAQSIDTLSDLNANGADELIVLGHRLSDGALDVFVNDSKTGEQLGRVRF
jgi:hypothetical protein